MNTNNDLVKRGYDLVAETYSAQRDQFKNNKYLDELTKLLESGSKVLGLGCGSGIPVDSYLIGKGYKVIGIDISDKQIELAKKNVPAATYEVKDMSSLQEKEYFVDAIVSFYAIFHTPRENHLTLLGILNSYLPHNGLMLITMGSSDWEGTEDDFHGAKMFWSHYDPKKNRKIVEDAGFQILLDEIDTNGEEKHQVILARKSN